ncbi:sugar kinase [Leifsonia xyli subsp. cynodontis DSM 46306]|uniref:Sugar kinase n=1 Tax=Leifsonia xyli subsp. cynodontis DSM 46306 TaxID=1389489 RepID=U3P4S7_LEIXC|nr:ROK family protein [Leifsonia xyli]AGW40781.1 sugar kinase [Leifsonia xyli subsp. cynodontis DSM 46306]
MNQPAFPSPTPLGDGEAVLAFDVGGTDMKAALIDPAGRIAEIVRRPTPLEGERTGEAVVAAVADLAAGFAGAHPGVRPAAAGLLVPGQVDDDTGVGVFAENLGWRDFPFRDRASAALGMPVSFSHGVRGAGEAEHRLGAAAPFRDTVVMAIGTGIAGAIFLDGRLHAGGGLAGEMGHSRVAEGQDCACGGHGCLEAVASAAAIARRYSALTGRSVPGAREVLERAQAGDPAATRVWESALDALALDLSHTVALLAPEAIVIGGGLSQAGDALFVPLAEKLDTILTFQRRPALLPALIGENAGVIGAALRARDLLAATAREPAL